MKTIRKIKALFTSLNGHDVMVKNYDNWEDIISTPEIKPYLNQSMSLHF